MSLTFLLCLHFLNSSTDITEREEEQIYLAGFLSKNMDISEDDNVWSGTSFSFAYAIIAPISYGNTSRFWILRFIFFLNFESILFINTPRIHSFKNYCVLIVLCELLRLIEVRASCFNHYCVGYDIMWPNVSHNFIYASSCCSFRIHSLTSLLYALFID